MRSSRPTLAFLCAMCFAIASPVASSAPPPVPAAPPQVFVPPSHAGGPVQCSDGFYEFLPGMVNFCLGVHDWESGRYQNAISWLKLAAGWGSKGAQYMLGLAYYNGDHVGANRPLGLAWLQLANERHNNKLIETVERSAVQHATPAERQQADALFQQLRQHDGDKVAALRAYKQFRLYSAVVDEESSGSLGGSGSGGCVFLSVAQWNPAQGDSLAVSPELKIPLARQARATHPQSQTGAGQLCLSIPAYRHLAQVLANHYFKGWSGEVTVEPLQQLPTAAPHQQ